MHGDPILFFTRYHPRELFLESAVDVGLDEPGAYARDTDAIDSIHLRGHGTHESHHAVLRRSVERYLGHRENPTQRGRHHHTRIETLGWTLELGEPEVVLGEVCRAGGSFQVDIQHGESGRRRRRLADHVVKRVSLWDSGIGKDKIQTSMLLERVVECTR